MNHQINFFPVLWIALALLCLPIGCKEPAFDELEIFIITTPPEGMRAEFSTEGPNRMSNEISVGISIKPITSNGKRYTLADRLKLVSKNEDVLLVSSASMHGAFVLTSKRVGQTCMDLFINEKNKGCIDVEVID